MGKSVAHCPQLSHELTWHVSLIFIDYEKSILAHFDVVDGIDFHRADVF